MDLPPLSLHTSLEKQWDEEEEPEEIETVLKVVPPAYHQYRDVFAKVKAEKLPPHHACDNHIKLVGLLAPNVSKGSIRQSSSSTEAPVLFVKKKDGGLHVCVHYCKLNAVTRKNRYPVPPMNQLLAIFNGSTFFSKIDLHVYLDDIMVFSSSEEKHVKNVASVLQRLRDNKLFFKASKCVLHASSVEYLGYVFFSSVGLKMDSQKVQQILNWCQPKDIKAFQSFLGFANFYHFSLKITPKKLLLSLPFSKKTLLSSSMGKLLVSFKYSKEPFTTTPILSHFNPSLPTIVDTDASAYALGSVLSQGNHSGKNPIAFDSHKLPQLS
ncbi:hypothetical protein O181_013385 [Austropuccinia psidii MF-1]|uniref:Reverse transcriptase domain-containing protein n=1 Tax=Austropuccinia psidii MF-1 TaxID=1389203 RepID=A0A9Q3BZR9_9BASI|nr:hypothetical protein [Austropuccinia psidii MF-1]